MLVPIVCQMAFLTEGPEIIPIAVLRIVVQMGNGQNDPRSRYRMGISVRRPAKFASLAGVLPDLPRDPIPVFRI